MRIEISDSGYTNPRTALLTHLPNYSFVSLDLGLPLSYSFLPSGNGKRGENPPLPRNCKR
jgi:hypothetical protein